MQKTLIGDTKTVSQIVNGDIKLCVAEKTVTESEKHPRRMKCVANMKQLVTQEVAKK